MTGTDVAGLSFEEAMAELERVVERLDSGQTTLEEAIALYQRGDALRARCEALLKEAELRVQKITAAPDGSVSAEDADLAAAPPARAVKSQGQDAGDDDIPF